MTKPHWRRCGLLFTILMAVSGWQASGADASAQSSFFLFSPATTSSGQVTINGVDTTAPSIPFTFDWGDGTVSSGWFLSTHVYSDTTVNYLVTVTAHHADGTSPQAQTLVFFGSPNYSDIWWNPLESGWGLTIADHQSQLFAVWYTYRNDGAPTWFVIPGGSLTQDRTLFSGDIYQTTGPPLGAVFDARLVKATKVGSAQINFAPPGLAPGIATFTYSVGAVSGTKQIQRQPFGNGAPNWGYDFTDIWWNPDQSGWGLTLSQHGDQVFGVWFTYDANGQPLFVVMPGVTSIGSMQFSGDLYTTRGPYFAGAFDPAKVQVTKAGSAILSFDDPVTKASFHCDPGPCVRHGHFTPTIAARVIPTGPIYHQPFGDAAPNASMGAACVINYSGWSACRPDNTQTRTELSRSPAGCARAATLSQGCTYVPPTATGCTYSYSDWSACQPGNTQSRAVVSATPPGCSGTPVLSQACTYVDGASLAGSWSGSFGWSESNACGSASSSGSCSIAWTGTVDVARNFTTVDGQATASNDQFCASSGSTHTYVISSANTINVNRTAQPPWVCTDFIATFSPSARSVVGTATCQIPPGSDCSGTATYTFQGHSP